jgi:hypothetical protein
MWTPIDVLKWRTLLAAALEASSRSKLYRRAVLIHATYVAVRHGVPDAPHSGSLASASLQSRAEIQVHEGITGMTVA